MTRREIPPSPDAESESSEERMINDLIRKRKLQQEALLKIMTSMDQPTEANSSPIKKSTTQAVRRPKKKN